MNRDLIFNELIRRNEPWLRGIVKKFIFDAHEHDDVFQDLCLHILSKLREATDDEITKWESGAWLNRIATNFCKDVLRRKTSKKNKFRKSTASYNQENDASEFDRQAYRGGYAEFDLPDGNLRSYLLDIEEVLKAFEAKYPKDYDYVYRRFVLGHEVKKIGTELNLPNASQSIQRALEKLKEMIKSKALLKQFDTFFSTDFC